MLELPRLFLIEDDEDFAFLMRKSLERAGFQVTICRTAADALIVLGQNDFQLVLLDQRLPDMTGLELLQILYREGIPIPVLMVTANGDEQLAAQVLRAGALDYIVKDRALSFLADLPKRVGEAITRHRLQQTNRLLIEALESAQDGIIITDLQGTLLHVNRALEVMSGYSKLELIGQNTRIFKSGVHPPEFYEEMWRTILSRQNWRGDMTNLAKNGSTIEASLTISPIVDNRGQLTHFVGIYRDMRERKLMERQLFQAQKMQSVGTLAGGVAHEFNNLLAGIQGYAALGLRDANLGPGVSQFLHHIVELSDRAANLTRQLLTFARKSTLVPQPTSMEKLLRATAQLVEHSLKIEVHLELPDSPKGETWQTLADANQLQQVLVNLALNARDALAVRNQAADGTRQGKVTFCLHHQVVTRELQGFPQNVPAGDYVVLEVRDAGCGMNQEILSQALDPFFSTKETGQGTGLGLPVAFGIIQAHQGFLTIDTQPGRGTRVSMYLHRLTKIGEMPTSTLFQVSQVLEPEIGPGRHILVIDDEEAVLDVVRRFLEIAGHKVTCATSTTQGLDLLADVPPIDLVILDWMIPSEEGAGNFQKLRRRQPGIPVLLCTGLLQADQHRDLLKHPGVDLIRKPFRMNELWYAVNKIMENSGQKKRGGGESPPN